MRDDLTATLYTRSGCRLCDETAAELARLADQLQFKVELVDIDADAEAYDRWWAEIPVVVAGATVLRAPISMARLRAALLAAVREAA